MKRLLSLALLGAVALAVPVANAQMRGGGGMMGGRGGPVMSHGPVGGGAAFSHGPAVVRGPAFAPRGPAFAPRGPVGAPRVSPAIVAGRPAGTRFVTPSGHVFFSSNPFFFNHFHHHHFFISACAGFFPCFNNGFFFGSNFGFGSPFGFGFGAPFYSYPYYGSYPFSSDYTSAQPQQTVSTDSGSQVELAREVQRLSDQIEELRYEEGRRAEPKTTLVPPSTSLTARTPAIATTFVLRDGSHVAAQNYALTGQTLWIFDEHKARKIPMSDIDREATEKFNADNGIVIRLP